MNTQYKTPIKRLALLGFIGLLSACGGGGGGGTPASSFELLAGNMGGSSYVDGDIPGFGGQVFEV